MCLLSLILASAAQSGEHTVQPSPKQPTSDKASVEAYIRQLGSSDYDLRIEAMEELRVLGERARAPLEKAAKGSDPQVAHSAMNLLKRINRATVEVKLLRPDGTAVPETNITMQLIEKSGGTVNAGQRRQENMQTEKNGVATFGNIDPGVYYLTFRAQVAGFLPLYDTRRDHKLKVGMNTFDLKLRTGSKISGQVVDQHGRPVAGKKVVLARNYLRRYADKNPEQFVRTIINMPSKESGADGSFVFETVPDSKYFMVVMEDKKVLFKGDDFDVAADKPVDLEQLKLKDGADKPDKKAEKKEEKKEQQAEKQAEKKDANDPSTPPGK